MTVEFTPLFQAGFHDLSTQDLSKIFVEPFPENQRRKHLTERLNCLLEIFSELGVEAEIWLDGSYSTIKPEPGDIDMAIFYNPEQVNKLSPEKIVIIEEINNRALSRIRYECDIFLLPNNDLNMRSYWRGWFGFSREEIPKGIPRLRYAIN